MKREDTDELLGLLDGSLSANAKERLLDALQEDPSRRKDFESMQALARSLSKLPEEKVPADFASNFARTHLKSSLKDQVLSFFQGLPKPALPALAAASLAACLMVFGLGSSESGGAGQALAHCTLIASSGSANLNGKILTKDSIELHLDDAIEVGDDFEGSIQYPDGTFIEIKPESQVVIKHRGLSLKEGEVWLEVTKDLRGFQVQTPLAMAAVKGTEFGVEFRDGSMDVRVEGGLVEVASKVNRRLVGAGKSVRVGADQNVLWSSKDHGTSEIFGDQGQGLSLKK